MLVEDAGSQSTLGQNPDASFPFEAFCANDSRAAADPSVRLVNA
jgi:hypothetical protein